MKTYVRTRSGVAEVVGNKAMPPDAIGYVSEGDPTWTPLPGHEAEWVPPPPVPCVAAEDLGIELDVLEGIEAERRTKGRRSNAA